MIAFHVVTALGRPRAGAARPGRRRAGLRVEPLEARTLLDGSLDPGFGRVDLPGRATAAVAGLIEVAGVALQPGGKVVVAGTVSRAGNDDFAVVRFDANGAPDPSFGVNGLALIGFDLGFGDDVDDRARALTVQADGKIVVVGQVEQPGGQLDFGIARLLADGAIDPGFGVAGKVVVGFDRGPNIAERDDMARAVAVQADGKIVVVGQVDDVRDENDFGIVRLLADGRLDPGFGLGGKVVVEFDLGASYVDQDDDATAVLIQPDGRIVVAGPVAVPSRNRDFGIARLEADGRLDPGFGLGGKVVVGFDLGNLPSLRNDVPSAAALQADGKIVIAGTVDTSGANQDFGILRLNPDGTPDPGFGAGGRVHVHVGGGRLDSASGVAVLLDGRIVVSGDVDRGDGNRDFAAIRLTTSGALDPSFGVGGRSVLGFDLGPRPFDADVARGAALDSAGRLVIAGEVDNGAGGRLVGVARLRAESRGPGLIRIGPVVPDPRRDPVESVTLEFTEPVDPATLAPAVTLFRDGAFVPLAGAIRVVPVPGTWASYEVSGLAGATATAGSYTLVVDLAAVRNPAGVPGSGIGATSFVVAPEATALVRVGPVAPDPRNLAVDAIEVEFSGAVAAPSFTPAALALTRDGVAVPLGPEVVIRPREGSATTFVVSGLAAATGSEGAYLLTVDPSLAVDPGGRPVIGAGSASFVIDLTAPRVAQFGPVSPSIRRDPVAEIEVRFSEPIAASSFAAAALRLTRDGADVPIGPDVQIAPVPGTAASYRISGLAGVTGAAGFYMMALDATAVRDLAGNPGVGTALVTFYIHPLLPALLDPSPIDRAPTESGVSMAQLAGFDLEPSLARLVDGEDDGGWDEVFDLATAELT